MIPYALASHNQGCFSACSAVRYGMNAFWALLVLSVAGVMILPASIIWSIWDNKRVSVQRRIFAISATIQAAIVLIFGILKGSAGPPWWNQNFVAVFGFFFNLFFASFLVPWMTRPLIKIFSDKMHEKITTTVIALNGIFFAVYSFEVNNWYLYWRYTHPAAANFFYRIFL